RNHPGARGRVGSLPLLVPSPQSEAVTHEMEELSLQPTQNLPPLNERKNGENTLCSSDDDAEYDRILEPATILIGFFIQKGLNRNGGESLTFSAVCRWDEVPTKPPVGGFNVRNMKAERKTCEPACLCQAAVPLLCRAGRWRTPGFL
uniref:Uncharacterized protein n=1 Tax=Xiphophorus couchianus TaxID=32473 RepID=A0A3B5L326_9TELE